MEARAGIEPAYTDLQSAASPLRHRANVAEMRRFRVVVKHQFAFFRMTCIAVPISHAERRRGLQLAVFGFESGNVAGRQIAGLVHPVVAGDAALKIAEITIDFLDLG